MFGARNDVAFGIVFSGFDEHMPGSCLVLACADGSGSLLAATLSMSSGSIMHAASIHTLARLYCVLKAHLCKYAIAFRVFVHMHLLLVLVPAITVCVSFAGRRQSHCMRREHMQRLAEGQSMRHGPLVDPQQLGAMKGWQSRSDWGCMWSSAAVSRSMCAL